MKTTIEKLTCDKCGERGDAGCALIYPLDDCPKIAALKKELQKYCGQCGLKEESKKLYREIHKREPPKAFAFCPDCGIATFIKELLGKETT